MVAPIETEPHYVVTRELGWVGDTGRLFTFVLRIVFFSKKNAEIYATTMAQFVTVEDVLVEMEHLSHYYAKIADSEGYDSIKATVTRLHYMLKRAGVTFRTIRVYARSGDPADPVVQRADSLLKSFARSELDDYLVFFTGPE